MRRITIAIAAILVWSNAGCSDMADYDQFPGWPDDEPRDGGEESDTGDPDTELDPDTEETEDPETDSFDTETDVDTDSGPPTDGSTWCWMVAPDDYGYLAVLQIDMDTGYWFEQGVYGDPDSGATESYHTAGIARLGDTLVMAGYTGNEFHWIELDISAETVFEGNDSMYTVSVGSDGTRLVTDCGEITDGPGYGLCFYDDFSSLNAGTPDEMIVGGTGDSRLCATEDHVYTAWHSTEHVSVLDIDSAEVLFDIALEDWDGWVWGMSVAGGMLHLASGGFGNRVARFDPETGELLDEVYLAAMPYSHPPTGLWCEAY